MLLTTYNNNRELRVYRVELDFERLEIRLQHLKVLNTCGPLNDTFGSSHPTHGALILRAHLSILKFLAPAPQPGTTEPSQPCILAAFSYLADDLHSSSSEAQQFTVLCRWELESLRPALHPGFGSLSSKKSNAPSTSVLPVRLSNHFPSNGGPD